jgi:hypothetical protein
MKNSKTAVKTLPVTTRLTPKQVTRILSVVRANVLAGNWCQYADGRTAYRKPVTDLKPAWKNPRATRLDFTNLTKRVTWELYGVVDSAPVYFASLAAQDTRFGGLTEASDELDPRSNEARTMANIIFTQAIAKAQAYQPTGTTKRVKAVRKTVA